MTALTTLDPIPPPDLRKPTGTLSLPGWLASQRNALAPNLQTTDQGFRDVMTLPANLMPTAAQRTAIERHRDSLRSSLGQTPESDERCAAETLTAVTKMMLALGGPKASESAAEAKAEAYSVALEDVPSWAVVAVQRRWYRSDCGKDEHGRPYDYRFMPDPATVRRLAISETFRVRNQITDLEQVLIAVPFVDCSAEIARGRDAMAGLYKMLGKPELAGLTFAQAVELGRTAATPPAQPQREAAE